MPYIDMVKRYKEKYDIDTTVSMFTNWSMALGLPKRSRSGGPVPYWTISDEHRGLLEYIFLLARAREREGMPVAPEIANRYEAWKKVMNERNWVVHYDPDTEHGFFYMDARPGIDSDYVRVPD